MRQHHEKSLAWATLQSVLPILGCSRATTWREFTINTTITWIQLTLRCRPARSWTMARYGRACYKNLHVSCRKKQARANIVEMLVWGSRHLQHDGCITATGEQKKNWPGKIVSSTKIKHSKILKVVITKTFENLHHCPQERSRKEEALWRLHAVFRTCMRVSVTTK